MFELLLFPLLLLFILALSISIPFKPTSKNPKNTPPSPPKLPIIGNLHQLVGLNPHHSLRALTQKHGPLITIHLGSVPVLVVSSAKVAREFLKTHDLAFSNRPKLSITHKITYGCKDIGFAPYGEYWRQVKSITVLRLLSKKRVQSIRHIREKELTRMLEFMERSNGCVVDFRELIVSVTNNIICEVTLGRTYGDQKFKNLILGFQVLLGAVSVGSYIPWLFWVDWLRGLDERANKVCRGLDEIFDGIIEEHINKKKNKMVNDDDDEAQDFVDILLDVQSENAQNFTFEKDTIKAVILDVLTGGTDTTSITIEWALSELIKHPHIMKKLQTEVTKIAKGRSMITEDDVQDMHYLKAVIKEALRLHTPFPLLVPRESRYDVKIMGYDIKQGTQVIFNAWAIGRDPSLWEEPDEFKPERFLNSCIDYKGFDFELLPFGAGRRGCPGIEFAIAINHVALANIVYKFDLKLPNEGRPEDMDMSEIYELVAHRKSPLKVVAIPRF